MSRSSHAEPSCKGSRDPSVLCPRDPSTGQSGGSDDRFRCPVIDPRLVRALRKQLKIRDGLLQAGATRVGWKLGLGESERIAGQIAVGHLTSATCLEDGDLYVSGDPEADLHADVEVAVELGHDVAAAGDDDAVYRAIQAYAVALEICDLQQLPDRAESIVASNVLHRAVAFGSWSSRPAAAGVMASLLVDGEMKAADQANLDVAPRLRAAAHVLESVDERLEAGDRIITSLVAQVPLSPGKVVTADMGVLGRVTLSV